MTPAQLEQGRKKYGKLLRCYAQQPAEALRGTRATMLFALTHGL